jgi:hypothetical protein
MVGIYLRPFTEVPPEGGLIFTGPWGLIRGSKGYSHHPNPVGLYFYGVIDFRVLSFPDCSMGAVPPLAGEKVPLGQVRRKDRH